MSVKDCLLTGPSHSVRLRHAVRTEQLPPIFGDVVGVGGMPVWSPRVVPYVTKYSGALHIVGDFRFGNRALFKHATAEQILSSGEEHLAIAKENITAEFDKIMYDTVIQTVHKLSKMQNQRFLFWDLSIREGENKIKNKYTENGRYRHPVWNLEDVLLEFPNHAINTSDLSAAPSIFYMDSSAHPSIAGWLYLAKCYANHDVNVGEIKNSLTASIAKAFSYVQEHKALNKVVICGNSKFSRLLKKYDEDGVFPLPSNIEIDIHLNSTSHADLVLYFPPAFGLEAATEAKKISMEPIFEKLKSLKQTFKVIPYDLWASEKILTRMEYLSRLKSKEPQASTYDVEEKIMCGKQDFYISSFQNHGGMIELNDGLQPTALGIVKILACAMTGYSEAYGKLVYDAILADLFQGV
ncbi:hypothetical protein [Thioclava kandeliae]|uniref:SGNH/GDSL hydrolase family protein n=1 Tax=Thioclava kandeliae TaxID=3070818 RepID=A0ABV1SM36_9RHOB